jgi:hypothetical protein
MSPKDGPEQLVEPRLSHGLGQLGHVTLPQLLKACPGGREEAVGTNKALHPRGPQAHESLTFGQATEIVDLGTTLTLDRLLAPDHLQQGPTVIRRVGCTVVVCRTTSCSIQGYRPAALIRRCKSRAPGGVLTICCHRRPAKVRT